MERGFGSQSMVDPLRRVLVKRPDERLNLAKVSNLRKGFSDRRIPGLWGGTVLAGAEVERLSYLLGRV